MGREEFSSELWEVAPPQTPYSHLRINTSKGGSASVIGDRSGRGGVGGGGGGSSDFNSRRSKDLFPEESRWRNVQRYVDAYGYASREPDSAKFDDSGDDFVKPRPAFKSFRHDDVETLKANDVNQCIIDARRDLNLQPASRGPDTPVVRDWDKSELSFRSEIPLNRQSLAYPDRGLERVRSLRRSSTPPRSITREQLAEAVELARLGTDA